CFLTTSPAVDVYTLSLHDALPISKDVVLREVVDQPGKAQVKDDFFPGSTGSHAKRQLECGQQSRHARHGFYVLPEAVVRAGPEIRFEIWWESAPGTRF